MATNRYRRRTRSSPRARVALPASSRHSAPRRPLPIGPFNAKGQYGAGPIPAAQRRGPASVARPKPVPAASPAAPPTPPATGMGAVSGVRPGPAPESPEGRQLRSEADMEFGLTEADVNRALYEAALSYGDRGAISRFAGMGYGPDVDNPNSRLAQISRGQTEALRNTGEAQNRGNTFFSGLHLRQRGEIDEQAGRDRLAAQQAFDTAVTDLYSRLARVRAARESGYGRAGLADISSMLELPPEATGEVGGGGAPGSPGQPGAASAGKPAAARRPVNRKYGSGKTVGKKKTGETAPIVNKTTKKRRTKETYRRR